MSCWRRTGYPRPGIGDRVSGNGWLDRKPPAVVLPLPRRLIQTAAVGNFSICCCILINTVFGLPRFAFSHIFAARTGYICSRGPCGGATNWSNMRSIPLWAALALLLCLASANASPGSSPSSVWQRALFARNSRNLRRHGGSAAASSASGDLSSDAGLGAFDVFASNLNSDDGNNNEYGQLFAPYALEQPQQQPQHQQVSASDGRETAKSEK